MRCRLTYGLFLAAIILLLPPYRQLDVGLCDAANRFVVLHSVARTELVLAQSGPCRALDVDGQGAGGATDPSSGLMWSADDLYDDLGQVYRRGHHRFPGDADFDSYLTLFSNYGVRLAVPTPPRYYELQVHARNSRPGPVILHVRTDDLPIGLLLFDRDDDSWETRCLEILPLHWLASRRDFELNVSVRFVNDGGHQGERDANIAWIRLVPIAKD